MLQDRPIGANHADLPFLRQLPPHGVPGQHHLMAKRRARRLRHGLVPGNGAASQAALVTGLNSLLAALVGTGGMEWINQAKPVGSPAGDT